MDEQSLYDKLEPMYNSFMAKKDVVWKTSRKRWMIETGSKRGLGRSVLAARHRDDDDDDNNSAKMRDYGNFFTNKFKTSYCIKQC